MLVMKFGGTSVGERRAHPCRCRYNSRTTLSKTRRYCISRFRNYKCFAQIAKEIERETRLEMVAGIFPNA
jgi:hypothetical protein